MNREVAAVFAILLPILVVLVIVRRRRVDVVVATPAVTVPPRHQPIHWYIAANGKLSWWRKERDGSISRGPFFAPGRLLYFLDNRPVFGSIRKAVAEGDTPGNLFQYFDNVMCYWPVADPRLGEDVKSYKIVAAMERGLELLMDDLANFRHAGQPDPDLAPCRATSRLRREANDDGSWLLAADWLGDIEKHRLLGAEAWASRVGRLIEALS